MGYGSVSELTGGEKRDRGYRIRILMLTLVAPDIVGAIMDGRQPVELGVHVPRQGGSEARSASRPGRSDLPYRQRIQWLTLEPLRRTGGCFR